MVVTGLDSLGESILHDAARSGILRYRPSVAEDVLTQAR